MLVIAPSLAFEVASVDAHSQPYPVVRVRLRSGWYASALSDVVRASGGKPITSRAEGGVQWRNGRVQIRASPDGALRFPLGELPAVRLAPCRNVTARRLSFFVDRLRAGGFHIVESPAAASPVLVGLVRSAFKATYCRWTRASHRFYDWHFKRSVRVFLVCLNHAGVMLHADELDLIVAAAAPCYRRARFVLANLYSL